MGRQSKTDHGWSYESTFGDFKREGGFKTKTKNREKEEKLRQKTGANMMYHFVPTVSGDVQQIGT